ncbi:MAG: S1C family serine protease [Candidatus Cardinium sp.]|uniref:S1C family serine protease n=1 Tax=Cardinium endosymbiont of Dermatophagoides farinae TaxID=2597823 RepID=UPI0011833E07|nr:S1C family serine protease [Cardinium endosymbiont of Dermatophagoides farinae]TSJ80978.1 serine protease [Cardinium endosymbiont of Dermatophagoides farinae]UWW97004.1 MAG: S1C family serine protease [Candidatus Cardinium sp.]
MRYKNILSTALGLFLAIGAYSICYGKANFKSGVIENVKRSVVSVDIHIALTAYIPPLGVHGAGVVIDKQAGYILTSGIIVGPSIIADYTIGFFNGAETKAKLAYYDPWVDFAILQVDPSMLPKEIQPIKLSNKDPLLGQSVFTIAKKKKPLLYTGSIDDANFSLEWTMPQHCIRVSMPSKTGAYGSLIFNEAGEDIALNCAGSATMDVGLHLAYVHHALAALKQQQLPVRKHIGALLTTYPLDEAIRYNHLSQSSQKEYLKKFPDAKNKILQVQRILKGTPAAGKLYPGDLIWKFNGQWVGPNLVDFDRAMNKSSKDQLVLTIFRNGSFYDITLPYYNLNSHRITKMVQFGGTTFFETDDFCSTLAGVSPKTLVACIAAPNTIFKVYAYPQHHFKILGVECLAINGQPVQKLDALIALIPQLVREKYFTMAYINHLPPSHGLFTSFAHDCYTVNVEYDPNLAPPKVWEWDPVHLEWKGQEIVLD